MFGNSKFVSLEVDGYKYFYRFYKNSSSKLIPVFIFNGFLQNMNSWIKYIKFFIGDSSVIIADLPGAGNAATIDEGKFDLDRMGYYVYQILEKEEIEKIDIISASYGAGIAYGFAKNYPDRVKHLMAAGAIAALDQKVREKILQSIDLVKSGEMKLFADLIISLLLNVEKEDEINKLSIVRKLLSNQFRNLPENDREKYIVNSKNLLNHPVLNVSLSKDIKKLLVTGEYDIFTDPEDGKKLAAKLSNCMFTTIQKADHLFHLEQTDVTLNLIKRFFRDESLESVQGINEVAYY